MFTHKSCWLLVLGICIVVARSNLGTKRRSENNIEMKYYSTSKGIGTTKGINSHSDEKKSQTDFSEHDTLMRSTEHIKLNVRTRREVRTLVEALKTNAEKLENLKHGMDILVKSMMNAEKLENLTHGMDILVKSMMQQTNEQSNITTRLDHMNPLFVSMFVMLADVAFSTSPRIAKHQETVLSMSRYFRENILTNKDVMMFDEKMTSVIKWYASNMTSCADYRDFGFGESGVYRIRIPNSEKLINVICDQDTDGGGWLVIQRRQDGSEDFYRSWSDYQHGFGSIEGEFWLGNDNLHQLTSTAQELRVDLVDFDGNTAYAKYSSFAVGSSTSDFTLSISGYSGTAGDALDYHNGMKFSTKDSDNDSNSGSCATRNKGAWWFKSCLHANLNGLYFNKSTTDITGLTWYQWKNKYEALKKSEMKIRPKT